jgi:hypothetical protein
VTTARPSRRRLLGLSPAAGILLSPVLRATRAAAAGLGPPRRLVFFHSPLGTVRASYLPPGSEAGLDLAASRVLAPLAPFRDRILVIDGMKRNPEPPLSGSGGGNHKEQGVMLTGRTCDGTDSGSKHGNVSIDQFLRSKLPDSVRIKSLELFHRPLTGTLSADRVLLSARGPNLPVVPEGDPRKAFDAVFAGVATGGTAPGGADPAREALRARRRSVLDAVVKEITRLQGALAGAERAKLDQHMSAIRELEKGLEPVVVQAAGCRVPVAPAPGGGGGGGSTSQAQIEANMTLVACAMSCDLLRVAVIGSGGGRDGAGFAGLGGNNWHDDYTHGSGGLEQHTQIHRWYAERFAFLVRTFAAHGLLDASALVFFSEQGARGGGGPTEHSGVNLPYVVAGSCGGYFKQGRLVNVGAKGGHKDFLFNCLRAMGHEDAVMGNVRGEPIADLAM